MTCSGQWRGGFRAHRVSIVDARTAEANEIGENSHERYKERQIMRVKARLAHE